jgi:hypothetical protein
VAAEVVSGCRLGASPDSAASSRYGGGSVWLEGDEAASVRY